VEAGVWSRLIRVLRLLTKKSQVGVAAYYCFDTTVSRIAASTPASKLSQPAEAVAQRFRCRREPGPAGCGADAGHGLAGGVTAGGPFQALMVAIWWVCSLLRLWLIISNRHSVRTAVLPLRRNRVTPLLWRV
jgi:hypothetical protein